MIAGHRNRSHQEHSPLTPSTASVLRSFRRFKFRIHFFYQRKDLIATHFFYRAGYEMLRQELPALAHFIQKVLHVLADGPLILLIRFGEHETEWNTPFA